NFLMSTLYTNYNDGEYLYFKVSENKEVQDIIEKIIVELYEENVVSKAKIKLLVGLLLVELVKNSKNLEISSTDDFEKKMIVEIIKYIDENYKVASLLEISASLKQNDYKISKLIKKHLGCTFKDLLQEKRLSKSEELLNSTNLPISEIIEVVGYENISYFYKIFRAKYNMTPKDYRKKVGKL
ncbi:MAG: helix-turn-helix domain-containing protein, partial [Peptostreptococcaceae bacterium]